MKRYSCEIGECVQDENTFFVALLNVPDFPSTLPIASIVRTPLLAVIGAREMDGEVSFITLSADEKHCIGDALVKYNAGVGVWKYCNLYLEK